MKIVDHKIEGVKFVPAGTRRALIVPTLLVIHYTATQHSPIKAFAAKGADASAHLVIETDGTITQAVEFNRRAAHAGDSEWRGRQSCNAFSIGIELVNPGPIVFRDGVPIDTTARKPFSGTVVEAHHANANCPFRRWAAYPEEQMAAVIEAARAICATYGIKDVAGHEDVCVPKGRKIDPGPAFDWTRFRAEVFA